MTTTRLPSFIIARTSDGALKAREVPPKVPASQAAERAMASGKFTEVLAVQAFQRITGGADG